MANCRVGVRAGPSIVSHARLTNAARERRIRTSFEPGRWWDGVGLGLFLEEALWTGSAFQNGRLTLTRPSRFLRQKRGVNRTGSDFLWEASCAVRMRQRRPGVGGRPAHRLRPRCDRPRAPRRSACRGGARRRPFSSGAPASRADAMNKQSSRAMRTLVALASVIGSRGLTPRLPRQRDRG